MGKKRIIAETGAGQHGVATATVYALFDMDCTVYMGAEDVKRQELNVFRMELLGAKVISVTDGTQTLKNAVDAALEDFVANRENTFYMLGSAVGPHPYPMIVKTFQSIIGKEARVQILSKEGCLADAEALDAFKLLSRTEGIILAIESAHAIAYGATFAKELGKSKIIIINLSGRGDKDVAQVKAMLEQ